MRAEENTSTIRAMRRGLADRGDQIKELERRSRELEDMVVALERALDAATRKLNVVEKSEVTL